MCPHRPARLLALVPVAALALGAAGCASDTSGEAVSNAPKVPTVGAATGDGFVHGVVARDGEPVRGARVVVELWPAATSTAAGTPRMSMNTRPVTTDAAGRWAVALDPDRVPAAYLPTRQRRVAFDLRVFDKSQFTTWSSTMYLHPRTQVWRSQRTRAADRLTQVDVDLGRERVALTDSLGRTTRSAVAVR